MPGTGSVTRGYSINAPAKLNLLLELLGKRTDGFHDLESLMVMLDFSDQLEVYPCTSDNISLRCLITEANSQNALLKQTLESENNLVMKAARLLQKRTNSANSAEIILHKRIPSEAGLGGGSSDAAAALIALNQLWQLRLSREELCELGAELGSDVPFFLSRSSWAICTGRGEFVREVKPRPAIPVVITKPASGLSTKAVFQHCEIPKEKHSPTELIHELESGNLARCKKLVYNALDMPGKKLNPDLHQLDKLLERESATVSHMTGSGSACFLLCSNFPQAIQIANRLRGMGYHQTHATRTGSQPLYCKTITRQG